ncbi:hypothetical protein KBC77_04390 [Candidatus Saccharibacteria bacterium]|nr:hypothetical protein [Candidatus Saccharibacteria bacterium]
MSQRMFQILRVSILTFLFCVTLALPTLTVSASARVVSAPVHFAYNKDDCADIQKKPSQCKLLTEYINPAIKLLAAIAAVATIIGITVGGIRYSISGGDPQQVSQGKGMIIKSLTGFVAFMFLASFIQFMTPGGVKDLPGSTPNPSASVCAKGNGFLGLKPWYVYLPDDRFDQVGASCAVTGFQALPKTGMSDLVPVALAVLDGLLRISGLVAAIFVIVGGVKYITSQGEPSATAQAKDTIINAIIGLVIVMIAATVVNFVGTKLIN